MNKHLKMVSSAVATTPVLSETAETVVRSSDYSIGELEMALAISSFPPERRKNAWLLALAAPIAAAGIREAIRPKFFGDDAKANPFALLAPALVGLAGAGVLLMTKYGGPRYRGRCG